MDQTRLFNACIKAVKVRQKNSNADGENFAKKSEKNAVKKICPIAAESREIVRNCVQIRDFLLEHRKEYVNVRHLTSISQKMTDYERDKIDAETENLIKISRHLLTNLKDAVKLQQKSSPPQLFQHRSAVLELIESFLKGVCKIYAEQRAIRVKKTVDMKKFSRLEILVKDSNSKSNSRTSENPENHLESSVSRNGLIKSEKDPMESEGLKNRISKKKEKNSEKFSKNFEENSYEFSPEETEIFQKENQLLYRNMNSMVDEIAQIEGKVVEIARLQEIFSEKILEQDQVKKMFLVTYLKFSNDFQTIFQVISRVNETAIVTTENIQFGNEQIRQAMKSKAGMRVWILFFLIVMSFTLLFLDWYNP